jgi:hypothetical protein
VNVKCDRHFIGTFCVIGLIFGSLFVLRDCVHVVIFVIVSCAHIILCLRLFHLKDKDVILFTVLREKQLRNNVKV